MPIPIAGGWTREAGIRIEGTRDLDASKTQAPGVIARPGGGFRLFYTGVGPGRPYPECQGYILSAVSDDGLEFSVEPGIRLAPDPAVEYMSLRLLAPSIVQLADGRWRMYVEARGTSQQPPVIPMASQGAWPLRIRWPGSATNSSPSSERALMMCLPFRRPPDRPTGP